MNVPGQAVLNAIESLQELVEGHERRLRLIESALDEAYQEEVKQEEAGEPQRMISRGDEWQAMYKLPNGAMASVRLIDGRYSAIIKQSGRETVVLEMRAGDSARKQERGHEQGDDAEAGEAD